MGGNKRQDRIGRRWEDPYHRTFALRRHHSRPLSYRVAML